MEGRGPAEVRGSYLLMAAGAGVVAAFFAVEGKNVDGAETGAACGFAIAAGLCVLAAAVHRSGDGSKGS